MPTYARPKASFLLIIGLNKESTHHANIEFGSLMVVVGKGNNSLKVCQCLVWFVFGMGNYQHRHIDTFYNTQQLGYIRLFFWLGYHFNWAEGNAPC